MTLTSPLVHQITSPLNRFYLYWRPFFLRTPTKASAPAASAATTLGPYVSTGPYAPLPRSGRPLREYSPPPRRLVFTTIYHTFDVYRDPSLSLPYESSSFATLKGAQDVTCLPLVSPRVHDVVQKPSSSGRRWRRQATDDSGLSQKDRGPKGA